jgi:membrane-associated phospholipid phosphatase
MWPLWRLNLTKPNQAYLFIIKSYNCLWVGNLGLQDSWQKIVEKAFFKGKTSKRSVYIALVIGNVVLMLLLFFVLLNTVAYDFTGQLYPEGSGYRLDWVFGGLDNAIPFVPEMVIFYVYLFYPLSFLTMLYFSFVEYKKGYALGISLVIINLIAVLVYLIFPVSTFWWRQDLLANPLVGNFWADQVYNVFQNDSSFNCFPSLHAAISTICFYTWFRYSKIKPSKKTKAVTITTLIIAIGVILSTLFIKQHYIADEIAGAALAIVVGKIVFDKLWRVSKKKEFEDALQAKNNVKNNA